ncbi:uncharacterized protein si:ch211-243a20.3 [Engraulis encrasicolus]|uniref:uncharacterized protein si:ch211-243a20.3 n=1 Tax=Engraulis encrasicolus TaxID=184585 RepID=UPI002FD7920D
MVAPPMATVTTTLVVVMMAFVAPTGGMSNELDYGNWNYREGAESVDVSHVRSVTRVLDSWGKKLFSDIKTLLHSQPSALLPDYSRVRPLSESLNDLFREVLHLQRRITDLNHRLATLEPVLRRYGYRTPREEEEEEEEERRREREMEDGDDEQQQRHPLKHRLHGHHQHQHQHHKQGGMVMMITKDEQAAKERKMAGGGGGERMVVQGKPGTVTGTVTGMVLKGVRSSSSSSSNIPTAGSTSDALEAAISASATGGSSAAPGYPRRYTVRTVRPVRKVLRTRRVRVFRDKDGKVRVMESDGAER